MKREERPISKALTVILIILILMPGSAFHDMLLIMWVVYLWRATVRAKLQALWKHAYRALWCVLGALTLLLMPRPFALPTDRCLALEKVDSQTSQRCIN